MNITMRNKKGGMNEISKMSKTITSNGFRFNALKKKNNLEQFALSNPKAKLMKGSLIYKIEEEDQAFIKQLASATKIQSVDKIRYKMLPLPRDGHSAIISENKMFIFGGDRNKFPFNDFFMFQLK